jgi:L-serine dehydratase
MNIFDVIGPVMIGPSSSHTAGAVRLGRIARSIYGNTPNKVRISLHGSFASTYKGHGTDRALAAGLMGWETDDERIPNALKIAKESGVYIEFQTADLGSSAHPNTVMFEIIEKEADSLHVTGCSIGGGRIKVTDINGFSVELTGEFFALVTLHQDRPGVIHQVTGVLAEKKINVAQMRVSRQKKGTSAVMVLEVDGAVDAETLEKIAAQPSINAVRLIESI